MLVGQADAKLLVDNAEDFFGLGRQCVAVVCANRQQLIYCEVLYLGANLLSQDLDELRILINLEEYHELSEVDQIASPCH